MIKVCRSLDWQEIRVGEEVDSRLDFRHKQDIFMQVFFSMLKALIDASYDIESRASLADSNLVSTISNDATHILAVLKQEFAEQISVLVDKQSLRVCHFYMFLYIYFAYPLFLSTARRRRRAER
jgi:hypothetical protein